MIINQLYMQWVKCAMRVNGKFLFNNWDQNAAPMWINAVQIDRCPSVGIQIGFAIFENVISKAFFNDNGKRIFEIDLYSMFNVKSLPFVAKKTMLTQRKK